MYRGRPWTIRQYAGFASAEESNERYRYLLEHGQTGLSVAFDLPTQLGYDSDDPRALGEVGRTGVAIDSLADMEILLDGIPLGEVSTSMTINAPASLLLLLYELVAEKQGVASDALRGTVQNDILKEYVARGNYIFPPKPSMRLTTDLFAYCAERIPKWNTISISGYHIREAGSTAVQELAFTLANGIAYCAAAVDAGLSPDEFGERLSFFFNAHNDFFVEVAKFRAARRLWARIMKRALRRDEPEGARAALPRADRRLDAHGAAAREQHRPRRDPGVRRRVRRHAVTAHERVRRGARAADATLGEARAAHAAAARRRGGRPRHRRPARRLVLHRGADRRARGARVGADRAGRRARRRGRGDRAGLRPGRDRAVRIRVAAAGRERRARHRRREPLPGGRRRSASSCCRSTRSAERRQLERTARVRAERDAGARRPRARGRSRGGLGEANLLPSLRDALRAYCTVGEICETLRAEWGMYDAVRPRAVIGGRDPLAADTQSGTKAGETMRQAFAGIVVHWRGRRSRWRTATSSAGMRRRRAAAARTKLGKIEHVVVIYEENHSFDNLYGGWEGVNGRANATPRTRRRSTRTASPYACLMQHDVNLTSPPLAGDLHRHDDGHDVHEPFTNTPFTIDDYIPATATRPARRPARVQLAERDPERRSGLPGGCTRDIVHEFYQEQYQLNSGAQNRYMTGSDAVGTTMGVLRHASAADLRVPARGRRIRTT